jgi:hypothetical protein
LLNELTKLNLEGFTDKKASTDTFWNSPFITTITIMYSRQVLSLFLASAFHNLVRSHEEWGHLPHLEIEKLSAECKRVLKNPKASEECLPNVFEGHPDMRDKMCQNRQRCVEENKKSIREACLADANTTEIKTILGSRVEYLIEKSCIKDSKGEYCRVKREQSKSEQETKQLMCNDCQDKLTVVMRRIAEQAQEGREQMMQSVKNSTEYCSNFQKQTGQSKSTEHISDGPSLTLTASVGIFIVLVSFSAALLVQF